MWSVWRPVVWTKHSAAVLVWRKNTRNIRTYLANRSTKPLKLVINEAREHSSKITPININTDTVVELIFSSQKQLLEGIHQTRMSVNQTLS